MFPSKTRIAATAAVVLSLVSSTFAQQAQTTPTAPQANVARGPDYVDFSGFKGKVFDVKHRDPRSLIQAIHPLGSGFKGATISYSEEFKILTVRDFPENIAAIEEALKRLDTPQPAQPDIELRMNVIVASNIEGVTNQFPGDLADVMKQMQAMLNYKNYSNIATVVQRVRTGTRNITLNGTAEIPGNIIAATSGPLTANYQLGVRNLDVDADSSGGYVVKLSETQFTFRGNSQAVGVAELRTDITLRNGERVVVGTATLGNKGLILVLSARVIK